MFSNIVKCLYGRSFLIWHLLLSLPHWTQTPVVWQIPPLPHPPIGSLTPTHPHVATTAVTMSPNMNTFFYRGSHSTHGSCLLRGIRPLPCGHHLKMVHSEWKNRSIFLTPQKWLFWHKLSSMDLRECILAIFGPPGPLGGVRGGRGGSGGVRGTKIFKFFWGHIWVPKC